ncbi:hypothetical protein GGX14DRAFT_658065 [Mycena pura]|uniref:Uncharacterized protein n=1 Tax=Mycena pura TaxID=153505 RepID=A0AAD7E2C3_9AGAR|nr:hypothetical protein GGX14DRAFT_658065 [Mycena pura]
MIMSEIATCGNKNQHTNMNQIHFIFVQRGHPYGAYGNEDKIGAKAPVPYSVGFCGAGIVEVEPSKTPWWYETSSGGHVQYEQTMSKYVEHRPVITSLTLSLAPRTSASLRDHAQDLYEAPRAHATTFETPAKYPSCRRSVAIVQEFLQPMSSPSSWSNGSITKTKPSRVADTANISSRLCSHFNYPGPLAASPAVHSAQPGLGRERWSTCNAIVQAYASQRLHDLLVHWLHPNGTAIGHGNIPQPLQRPYLPPMTIVHRYILHSSP